MDSLESIKPRSKLLFSSYNCYLYDFDHKTSDLLKTISADNKRDEKENILHGYIIPSTSSTRTGMGNACKMKSFAELYFLMPT